MSNCANPNPDVKRLHKVSLFLNRMLLSIEPNVVQERVMRVRRAAQAGPLPRKPNQLMMTTMMMMTMRRKRRTTMRTMMMMKMMTKRLYMLKGCEFCNALFSLTPDVFLFFLCVCG